MRIMSQKSAQPAHVYAFGSYFKTSRVREGDFLATCRLRLAYSPRKFQGEGLMHGTPPHGREKPRLP